MDNLYPIFDRVLGREEKQRLLRQTSRVIWLYGLSGSGKSTLASGLERRLHADGFAVHVLDGDNVRTGLNRDLGFSDADRKENIRRIAEVSRLFLEAGIITINSFITPTDELRAAAREIIGAADFIGVFVDCSFEACRQRDVKGLYARAAAGKVAQFTGRDSSFEAPQSEDLVLRTEEESPERSLEKLYQFVHPRVAASPARR